MPFDQEDPADNEKIRRLGTVIRPNWKAIEEGSNDDSSANKLKYWSVNLYARDLIGGNINPDPTQADDGIAIFSKNDADTTFPEIFIKHTDNRVTQMTKGPAVIAPTVDMVSYPNNGSTFLPGGLIMKYVLTPATSTLLTTYDWGPTATVPGNIPLGLTSFPNKCFNISVTALALTGASTKFVWSIPSYDKDTFTINIPLGTTGQYFVTAIGN